MQCARGCTIQCLLNQAGVGCTHVHMYPCTHVELTLGGSMGYKVGYNEPLIYRDGLVERDILRLPSPLDNLLVESGPPRARGDRAAAAGNVRVSKRPWV